MADIVEEVVLNWTDLTGKKTGASKLGSNKFYKATITDNGGSFTVTFNYGRVGQNGQTQTAQCANLDAARRTMEKKVNAKISKGYTKVELRDEKEEKARPRPKASTSATRRRKRRRPSAPKSSTPKSRTWFAFMYTQTGKAIAKGLSSSAGASEDSPLGNLSDKQLDKGADILESIEAALEKKRKPKKDDLIEMTNEYLSNIPRDIDSARKGGASTSTPSSSTRRSASTSNASSSRSCAMRSCKKKSSKKPKRSMTDGGLVRRSQLQHRSD